VKFGPVAVGDAAGAVLAHSVRLAGGAIRKGTLLTAAHVGRLRDAGVATVIVARFDADDVSEDAAAAAVAVALVDEGVRVDRPFTGRANLIADANGVLVVDRARIDQVNRVDPAITVATLPEYAAVSAGQMVATVKIIPFAVLADTLAAVAGSKAIRVAAFRPLRVGLVATELPSLKRSVMDKTRRLLDARLLPAGATVLREDRVAHDAGAVAAALVDQTRRGAELFIVFGASAVVDDGDVIPAGIRLAGGSVVRFGMPVDPGNLLVLGELHGKPVVGAPGCARSPKENGFDWIIQRLLAGIDVTSTDIAAMGVGGLLMEIPARPQPRSAAPEPNIAALVLAAGSSRRMGANKLVATVGGKPLVRIAAEAALGSRASTVAVVTGHRPAEVEAALAGLAVATVHNPDHASGLATSLAAGLASVPANADGIVILLADMPEVTSAIVDRLIAAFAPDRIIVPTSDGRRGNPVLWSRRFLAELATMTGDSGGRRLIDGHREAVTEVAIGSQVALDVDTPEALAAIGGRPG
jgi:molybdenum cofactor cytidylyltransferase